MLISFWHPEVVEVDYRDAMIDVATELLDVPLVTFQGPRIDVVHPAAEGYRLLAEAIAARLVADAFVR
jgi:lysophospholipase L1-like esterase